MASPYTPAHLMSQFKVTMHDHDPADSTVATAVLGTSWLDMRDYDQVLVGVMSSALTGTGPTAFTINAGTSAAGAGSTAIRTHALGTAPDAVGDYIWLEVDDKALANESTANLRYISPILTCNNAADECVVVIIARCKVQATGKTADTIAA